MKNKIVNFILLNLGLLVVAFAIVAFLTPSNVSGGGAMYLAMILSNELGMSIGKLMLLINIPLILIELKIFGKETTLKTIYGVVVLSSMCDGLSSLGLTQVNELIKISSGSIIFGTMLGGITTGFGIGAIANSGGTIGGTTTLARMTNHYTGVAFSSSLMMFDFSTLVIGGLRFGFIAVLYAIACMVITGQGIDLSNKMFLKIKKRTA